MYTQLFTYEPETRNREENHSHFCIPNTLTRDFFCCCLKVTDSLKKIFFLALNEKVYCISLQYEENIVCRGLVMSFAYLKHHPHLKIFPSGTSAEELACLCRRHETQIQSPGHEDPLEEGMATHSSILAWRIPWTEEPGGLQSMGPQRDMTGLSD